MKFNDKFKLMSVTVDVNDFCNMKCVYCWEQQAKNKLSMKNAKLIADKLISNFSTHNKSTALRLHFFGGEPLMDWDVISFMVNYMKEKISLWVGLTTNATLFTDKILNEIKVNDVHVMVSIDGKKERHDANRRFLGGGETHSIIVDAIKEIQRKEIDYEARMTILPKNAQYMAEDVKYLVEDLGIKRIAPCPTYDRSWSKKQLEDFGKSMEELYDTFIKYHNSSNWENKVYMKFFEDYLFKDLDTKHFMVPCGFGTSNSISIDTEGNVYPCHQIPTRKDKAKFITANIIKDEVYENDFVKCIKPYTFKSDKCGECPARGTICNGGCPMESYETNGDLLSPTCTSCDFSVLYYNVIKKIQKTKNVPFPIAPSERRDFLHSVIMRMLNNIKGVINDNARKEYDNETLAMLSQAIWTINEQIINNHKIHLNTIDLAREINEVKNLIRLEVLNNE